MPLKSIPKIKRGLSISQTIITIKDNTVKMKNIEVLLFISFSCFGQNEIKLLFFNTKSNCA